MKKIVLFIILNTFVLAMPLKDGKYSVRTEKSFWFWYPYTSVIIRNGEIVEAYHDRIKLDGRKASENDKYNSSMMRSSKTNPKIYSKAIPEEFFNKNKDLNKMDNIAGATDSVQNFKSQIKFLIHKAETEGPGNYIMSENQL